MKYSILTFFISLSFNCFTQSPYAVVHYKIKGPDQQLFIKKNSSDIVKETLKEINNLEYQLIIHPNEAYFRELEVMSLNAKSKRFKKMASLVVGTSSSYLTHLDENAVLEYREIDGVMYEIEGTVPIVKWTLEKDAKKIANYLCYKATSKYEYINKNGELSERFILAWYAPEIPSSFGPKGFGGLPGLILEFYESDEELDDYNPTKPGKLFYASNIKLNKKMRFDLPDNTTSITRTEFDSIMPRKKEKFQYHLKN